MGQQPLIAPPDRPGDRSTEIAAGPKSVVAACCINSAAMLRLADGDHYSEEQRAKFRTLNEHQARALFAAAEIADEMLGALRDCAIIAERGSPANGNPPEVVTDWIAKVARVAIAKATGG
jgi:hypothetical protein